MPVMLNYLIDSSINIYPGPSGFQRINSSYLYEYTKIAGKYKHWYNLKRYEKGKFVLVHDFCSDDFTNTPSQVSISGAEIRKAGNFVMFNITFGSPNSTATY